MTNGCHDDRTVHPSIPKPQPAKPGRKSASRKQANPKAGRPGGPGK